MATLVTVLGGVVALSGIAIVVADPIVSTPRLAAEVPTAQQLRVSAAAKLAPVSIEAYAVAPPPPPLTSQVAGLGEIQVPLTSNVAWPVIDPARITSPFGPREAPCAGCSTFHDGTDFAPGDGTPVMAIADGIVTTATNDGGGLGTMVEIQHHIDGELLTSSYGHLQLDSPTVTPGQHVTAGQPIGLVGSTGQSTGPHLHLELFPATGERIDAHAWLTQRLSG